MTDLDRRKNRIIRLFGTLTIISFILTITCILAAIWSNHHWQFALTALATRWLMGVISTAQKKIEGFNTSERQTDD